MEAEARWVRTVTHFDGGPYPHSTAQHTATYALLAFCRKNSSLVGLRPVPYRDGKLGPANRIARRNVMIPRLLHPVLLVALCVPLQAWPQQGGMTPEHVAKLRAVIQ